MPTLLVLFVLLTCCTESIAKNPSDVITKVISSIFNDDVTVCYIHDTNHFNHFVEESLMSRNPTYNIKTERLAELASRHCGGYLLQIRNVSHLQNHSWDLERGNVVFESHTRMLVVLEDQQDAMDKFFKTLTDQHALDVITAIVTEEKLTVKSIVFYSVSKRKVLLQWNDRKVVINKKKLRKPRWTPRFDRNFRFTISTFHCPPFIYVNEETMKVEGGIEHEIVKRVFQNVQVKYDYKIYTKSVYNSSKKGSKVHQLLHDLGKTSHLALCGQKLNAITHYPYDYTYPSKQTCSTFLVRKPKLLPKATFMFQPLQLTLWIFYFCVILFVSMMLRVLLQFSNMKTKNGNTVDNTLPLFYVIRMFSQSGVAALPPLMPVRLLLSFWLMGCVFFSTYYSAGMNNILQYPPYKSSINSIEDIVKQRVPWVYCTNFLHYYPNMVRETDTPRALSQLYNGKNKTEDAAIYVKMFDRFVQNADRLLEKENYHKYKVLRECLFKFYTVFGLSYHSPFTYFFDTVSRDFETYGISAHWLDVAVTLNRKEQDCFFSEYERDVERLSIDLGSLQGAFYLLIVGYVLGIAVFLAERGFYWRQCKN